MNLNSLESLKLEEPNVPESVIFEDLNAFEKRDPKYGERFIRNVKEWVEKYATLHDLCCNVHDLYEYCYRYEHKGGLNREAFARNFKEFFNLWNDDEGQTENFIRIYLEDEEDTFEDVRYRNMENYSWNFCERYIHVIGDCGHRWWDDKMGTNGTVTLSWISI